MNGREINVLLVIDDPADARQIRDMLLHSGEPFEVSWAQNLAAAVSQLRSAAFDVVLASLFLPDSKGLDTLGSIKAENPLAPIIVLAGMDDAAVAAQALQQGAQDYLLQGQLDAAALRRAIGYAMERQRSYDSLKKASLIDPLTGLFNRRGFSTIAAQQRLLAARAGKRVCVCYIDIEGLRLINDSAGHRQGDLAIIDTATVLQKTFRSSDVISRLGDDKFAVFCIEASAFNADIFSSRLNKNIDEYAMTHPRGFRLSLSIGTAFCEAGEKFDLEELLRLAGAAKKASHTPDVSDRDRASAAISILLIEDNPGDARLVREMLGEINNPNLTMQWAKSLAEGRRQLADAPVDVVLLDLDLPDSWGSSTIIEVVKCAPAKPVVVLTGSTAEETGLEAIKFGAQDYLIKGSFTSVTLGRIISYAIERKNIIEELRRAREREVAISSRIQQTLLLGSPPADMPGVEFAALTVPSQHVDGDFYDFIRYGDSCVDIIQGDVMGKGIPAALLGAAAKSYFLRAQGSLLYGAACEGLPAPDAIINEVNRYIVGDLIKLDSFITVCYARLDMASRRLQFVDCGHTKIVHYRAAETDCRLLDGVNMPLGFSRDDVYKTITIPAAPGDLFFFYSDGLTEARSPGGDFFGEERIIDIITAHADKPLEEITRRIFSAAAAFVGSQEFADDVTCVAVGLRTAAPAAADTHEGASLDKT